MKISVITAIYNGAPTLQNCIDSVTSQSWPETEHIIIDGGSTDGSVDILKANDAHFAHWKSEPDRGIYHAWNKGLRKASGDWVIFLGADDVLYDESVLESFVNCIAKHPDDPLLAYGKIEIIDSSGKVLAEHGDPWDFSEKLFFSRMSIPHPGCFHHKDLFSNYGTFDENFKIAGDYDFLLRVIQYHTPVFLEDIIVAKMKNEGISNNGLLTYRNLLESRRAQLKNNVSAFSLIYYYRLAKHYIKSLALRNTQK